MSTNFSSYEPQVKSTGLAGEKHYTVQELEELWGLSRITLTELFSNEPGVLKISTGFKRGKQGRITLRIPASVAERVHQKWAEVKR